MSTDIFPSAIRGLSFTVVKTMENAAIVQESPTFNTTRILQAPNNRWHWRLEYSILFDNPSNPNPNLAYTDLKQMIGFCQSKYNNYDSFLFQDPDDNFVGPAVITATWQPLTFYPDGAIIINSGHAYQVFSSVGQGRSGASIPTFVPNGQTVDNNLIWFDLGAATNGGTNWPNPQAQLQILTDGTNYYSPIQRSIGGYYWEDITDLSSSITVYDNGVLTTNYTFGFAGKSISGSSWSGLYLKWNAAPTGPITAQFSFYFKVRLEEPVNDFEKFVDMMWAMGGEEGVQGKGYLKLVSTSSTLQASSIITGTTPPFDFPAGATNMIILYPTTISNNVGGTGTTSYGVAGPNAFSRELTTLVGLGFSPPYSVFGGFSLPPSVVPGQVKAVYVYVLNTQIFSINSAAQPLCSGTTSWGTGASVGVPSFTGPPIDFVKIDGGAYPASSFPFSTIQITCTIRASVPASFTPNAGWQYVPRIVAYY